MNVTDVIKASDPKKEYISIEKGDVNLVMVFDHQALVKKNEKKIVRLYKLGDDGETVMPKEAKTEKQPVCIHKSVCTYVDRNTFCFYERKGIHCVYYFPKSEGVLLNVSNAGAPKRQSMIDHDIWIKSIVEKKLLDALDKRCEIAAREYAPDPDKGEWASDSHRDPFNEVREWILEMRK